MFNSEKIKCLNWYDILVVTIIMFGKAMFDSTKMFLALNQVPVNSSEYAQSVSENVTFTASQNWEALMNQLLLLVLAMIYLYLRNFDFKQITQYIKWNKWVPLQMLAFFMIVGLAMDLFYYASYYLFNSQVSAAVPSFVKLFEHVDLSLFIFSLFNGFYEEVFFLGVCLAVKKEWIKWIIPLSIFIRFSFHTYQGFGTAVALGIILGGLFYLLYRKVQPQNMLPFFLAHAIADMIGLSVIGNLFRI